MRRSSKMREELFRIGRDARPNRGDVRACARVRLPDGIGGHGVLPEKRPFRALTGSEEASREKPGFPLALRSQPRALREKGRERQRFSPLTLDYGHFKPWVFESQKGIFLEGFEISVPSVDQVG